MEICHFLEFLLLLVAILSKNIAGSNACRASFPHRDHVLLNHVIRTLKDKTFEGCTFSCELDPQCFSVNYIPYTKACELNKATREYFGGDFVKNQGAVYIDMVIREYHPCLSMRCENGGTCVTSPSVQCVCRAGFTGLHCENRNALGMESGTIPNSKITATSHKPGYDAWKGRLNGNSCWIPQFNSNTEYITITLPVKVIITAIATQGAPTDGCWVKSYEVQFHYPNVFNKYPKLLMGNTDKTSVVTREISTTFQAITVRIYPRSWASCIAMRIELYGN